MGIQRRAPPFRKPFPGVWFEFPTKRGVRRAHESLDMRQKRCTGSESNIEMIEACCLVAGLLIGFAAEWMHGYNSYFKKQQERDKLRIAQWERDKK
jgi:hypothetical protein